MAWLWAYVCKLAQRLSDPRAGSGGPNPELRSATTWPGQAVMAAPDSLMTAAAMEEQRIEVVAVCRTIALIWCKCVHTHDRTGWDLDVRVDPVLCGWRWLC